MNKVIYITGGVIVFVILTVLIILFISPNKKNGDSTGRLQHQDSHVDSRMLLHSVQLSAEIYQSFYMNRKYWINNLKGPVLIYRMVFFPHFGYRRLTNDYFSKAKTVLQNI